jgi:orotate phosphoribosyltransferase
MAIRDDILRQFLSILIIHTPDGPRFSKYEILKNISVLELTAQALAKLVNPKVEYLCALAMSGLPIGVAVARETKLPLVFYNRDAWDDDPKAGLLQVLAKLPRNATVAIVDTHMRSGNNSAQCCRYLRDEYGANVIQIITPFDFECRTETIEGIEYSSLGSVSEHEQILCDLIGVQNIDKIRQNYLQITSEFWNYPILQRVINTSRFQKATQLWGFPGRLPKPRHISSPVSDRLRQLPLDNIGIWNYFLEPSLVLDSVRYCIKYIDFSKFDGIVGLEALGSALAIYLALEVNYAGKVLLFKNEYGILPSNGGLEGNKLLIMQLRLETGRYAVEAIETIHELKARVDTIVTMRTNFGKWPIELGKLSLRKLQQIGIEIISMD